ncbi:hypothetical protein FYZ37_03365 [Mobiluncus curtisii]|uniref:Uncharacterized protein n=1 Tax=Mobiluncus curtisii TaxID=2051 RepID=A0A7Y0YC67_9ACTO|nr:hypothetical protein [Mobiluncus curtisii]MCV0000276.1 hypothetical protein [Mobiluncus curtisii]MCV0021687.1 hypothetical protein [Mobiluncus curtisii]NMW48847.1 hypothetical protein [Mobiluncus curtisii]NMW87298.1 hypothetical protein [Mobiluncus curtisii]
MKFVSSMVAGIGITAMVLTSASQVTAVPASASPRSLTSVNNTASVNGFTLWTGTQGRKIQQIGGSLRLVLAPGDTVEITPNGMNALWNNREGVTLVSFDAKIMFSSDKASIKFDENSSTLYAVTHDENSDGSGTRYGCANKWVAWGWTVAWTGLVCVPFGIATGGVGGFACGAAGGAIGTAISC